MHSELGDQRKRRFLKLNLHLALIIENQAASATLHSVLRWDGGERLSHH